MHGIELVGVNGGAVVWFAGVGGEGGLGVGEQGAHEHGGSLWMILGVAVRLGLLRSWPVRGEPELAGGGAKGERRREEVWVQFRARGA